MAKKMAKKISVHSVVILDRSGSMSTNKKDHENGLKGLVKELKGSKAKANTYFTLIQFDGENPFEVIIDREKVVDVDEEKIRLIPRGNTPLYDAIGKTVNHLDKYNDTDRAITVITDGQENASREFNGNSVRQLMKSKQEENWQFTFIGTAFDVDKEGEKAGFQAGRKVQFANNANSINAMYEATGDKLKKYSDTRVCGFTQQEASKHLDFSEEEVNAIKELK